MSSDAITLLGGTSQKISYEEASAGFVIPPSARPCVHDARRKSYLPRDLFRASSGASARLQPAAGREYLAFMKNIAKRDNYNAILVNRSAAFTA